MRKWLVLLCAISATAGAQIAPVGGQNTNTNLDTSRTFLESNIGNPQENDIIVVQCHKDSATGPGLWTDPTDFAQLDEFAAGGTPTLTVYLGWKRRGATAGEAMTFSTSGGTDQISCTASVLSGVDETTAFDVAYSAGSHRDAGGNNNNPNAAAPAITTVTDGAVVLVLDGITTTISGDGGPPASYTELVDGMNGTGAHRGQYSAFRTIATAGTETPGVFTHTDATGTADSYRITLALRPAAGAAAGEYDESPIVTAQDDSSYTVDGSLDAAGDVDAVACLKDQTAPTIAQVQAGDCTGDVAAESVDSDSPSTGDFDFTLTLSIAGDPAIPVHDIYVTDGTTLTTLADEFLDPATGEQFTTQASVAVGSQTEEFNDLVDPDIAAGDILICPTTTSPGGFDLDVGTDGNFVYTPPGPDDSRQLATCDVYDLSAEGFHAELLENVWNNAAPEADGDFALPFDIDVAWDAFDICGEFTDDDDDTLTLSLDSGTPPTGLTLGGTGNCTLDGDPTTEDETGTIVVFEADDGFGGTGQITIDFYPMDEQTMPDLADGDTDAAINDELTLRPWLDEPSFSATFRCPKADDPEGYEDRDQVLTQDPAAGTQVAFDAAFSLEVSRGPNCRYMRRTMQQ